MAVFGLVGSGSPHIFQRSGTPARNYLVSDQLADGLLCDWHAGWIDIRARARRSKYGPVRSAGSGGVGIRLLLEPSVLHSDPANQPSEAWVGGVPDRQQRWML